MGKFCCVKLPRFGICGRQQLAYRNIGRKAKVLRERWEEVGYAELQCSYRNCAGGGYITIAGLSGWSSLVQRCLQVRTMEALYSGEDEGGRRKL